MERLLNASRRKQEHRDQRYVPPTSTQILVSRTATSLSSSNPPRLFSSPDLQGVMPNEKDVLRGLNERFAGFIQKVHFLESQNRALEQEIEDIREKAKSSGCLQTRYEPELQELRMQVQSISVQKHQIELEHQRLADEFTTLREKYETETRSRTEAEESISALKKYTEQAYRTKQEMDRKADILAGEIDFLKKNHESEVAEMLSHMQETRVSSGMSSFGRGELTSALRDIRTQLEGRAVCGVSQAEQRFSSQLVKLTKAAEADRGVLIASKDEIGRFRRQLQEKNVELESARGMREALERQLYDLEQRHNAEIHHYQETIRELETELKNTKYDMTSHVHEYQNLLNVKMALDAEIYSYRKLLEGEESRYSTLSAANVSTPYVYRQSPIYTLPSVTRIGEPNRKSEPQYKFVEEIITETTREDIEILETVSDDAGEEQEADKECNDEITDTAAESVEQAEEIELHEDATDNQKANAEQLEKKLVEVSVDTEVAQNKLTASEHTDVKGKDEKTKSDDPSLKAEEPDTETKPQADITNDAELAGKEKQDSANEIHQEKSTEQKTELKQQCTDSDPDPAAKEKLTEKSSQKSEDQMGEEMVAKSLHVSEKTTKKSEEDGEVKLLEVEATNADSQPGSEKADAEQEAPPQKDSKAEEKDSLVMSLKNNADDSQKTPPKEEKNLEAKKSTDENSNKSLESKDKKTKSEKGESTQSEVEQRKQVGEAKSAVHEVNEQGHAEKKESAKEKELDQVQNKPKTEVMEERTQEHYEQHTPGTEGGLKTNETNTKEQIQTLVAVDKDTQQNEEKKEPEEAKKETSGTTKESKPAHQESNTKIAKDVQVSSSKKEQSIDQPQKDKALNETTTKAEKPDKPVASKVKEVSPKVDSTKPQQPEKDPTLPSESKNRAEETAISSMKAGTDQKDRDMSRVTENGVHV